MRLLRVRTQVLRSAYDPVSQVKFCQGIALACSIRSAALLASYLALVLYLLEYYEYYFVLVLGVHLDTCV